MIVKAPAPHSLPPAADHPTWGALLGVQASERPERVAVVADDATLTYSEFYARAKGIARSLLSLGVRRGDVVAILDGNTAAWLEVFSGASLIGAVCAPVNTWYQEREILEQLQHSRAAVLFSVGRFLKHDYAADLAVIVPALAASSGGVVADKATPDLHHIVTMPGNERIPGGLEWLEFLARGDGVSAADLAVASEAVDPDDILHILYTSGSTSRPKGVQVTHRGVIENAFQVGERLHLEPEDRFWHSGPLFYGLGTVFALPAVWTHGATFVIQPSFVPAAALALIEREKITAFTGYGNVTRALVQHDDFSSRDLSSLVKGATGFTREDKRIAAVDLGVGQVCAMYGLTESHGPCAITEAGDDLEVLLESQGFLVAGWEAELRDPLTGDPSPAGETGELFIRGRMMPGYLDDDLTNAAVFVDDGWFRTGDLVDIDADGRLRFRARAKEVLKVGGINVSPSEVEGVIEEHPDVRQSHVVGVPDAVKGQVLVAFVEPGCEGLTEEEVTSFVSARVARFKVPSHVLFRAEADMPRLASGKMPRFALVAEAARELGLS